MSNSNEPSTAGRHEATDVHGHPISAIAAPVPARSFIAEVLDAISVRTILLVIGVLLLQLGFILSYVGAFHAPKPHRIPIVVAAPAELAGSLVSQLNAIPTDPVHAQAAASQAAARTAVTTGSASAALLVDPAGTVDTLLVASGGGTSVATAAESVLNAAEAAQGRSLKVQDIVPLQSGDGRGLTGFYLVIGWIVGGYLVAALLGVAKGSRPANSRRALIRLLSILPYAVVSGLGGAIIVDPVLGALTGHLIALWWLGTLLVFAAATVTMAFQMLFGVLGIGVTVLVFVVLGNPSAGGAYQPAVLPPFWRALSQALPNGAGTHAVRQISYFNGNKIALDLIVISSYAAAGLIISLLVAILRQRRTMLSGEPTDKLLR